MILAIDFDGTIHDNLNPVPGRRMGPPIPGAKEALEYYHNQGHTIHIYTIWDPSKHYAIMDWMVYYRIPFDLVTNRKQNAHVYVDNRAVRFTDWGETVENINAAYNEGWSNIEE